MTVTLNITPEVEAGLLTQARASGMTVEEYLVSMVQGVVPPASKPLTPHERAKAYEAWSANHRPSPALSDFAVSREAMYQSRRDK